MQFLIVAIIVTTSQISHASDSFKYNDSSGQCENANGDVGLNSISFKQIKNTGNGECANLTHTSILPADTDNLVYRNWNLRGADFNYSEVLNLVLESADLRGVKMESMTGVYSYFEGRADRFTRPPDREHNGHLMGNMDHSAGWPKLVPGYCEVKNERIDCGQL